MTLRLGSALAVAAFVLGACGGSDSTASVDDTNESVVDQPATDELPSEAPADNAATSELAPAAETDPDDAVVSRPAPGAAAEAYAAVEAPIAEEDMFPDVIDATASFDGDTWTVAATLSSPYDTPARYADAWRVVGPDGTVYGERILAHDHANEQPFTRSQSGITIPDDVETVTIEGRDLEFGWGGATFELALSR